MEIKIEPLERFHNRNSFDCGARELNDFLQKYSFQNQKSHISKTFVAVDYQSPKVKDVIGLYTLSTRQINFDVLPKGVKHPRYPVSIARLARLAVDSEYQGKGIGGFLLHNALQKIKVVSQMVGIFAIVVDAKNAKAKSFYEQYGFVSLQETDLTLCLPIKVLDKIQIHAANYQKIVITICLPTIGSMTYTNEMIYISYIIYCISDSP